MIPLQQMNKLVDYHVVEALGRLFDQLEIQPDTLFIDITGAPFGLHVLNAEVIGGNGHLAKTTLNCRTKCAFQLDTIPFSEQVLALLFSCTVGNVHDYFGYGLRNGRFGCTVDDLEAVWFPP